MKKITFTVLLLLLSNLTFNSFVLASEKSKTYTNYYFFLQSFYQDGINNVTSTSNYTSFPLFESSNTAGNKKLQEAKEIELSRVCPGGKSDSCWSYSDFFNMYIKTETEGDTYNYYVSGNPEQVSTKYYKNGNTTYYTHGLWRPSGSSSWRGGSNATLIDTYGSNAESALSCAAFSTNNEVSIEPLNYNSKYFYATIIRRNKNNTNNPIADGFHIDWNYSLGNNNMSKCPDDTVVATQDNNLNTKVVVSPVLYKFKYTVTTNKCDYDPPEKTDLSCNDGINLQSVCNKTSIVLSDNETSVDVKIDQKGTVSNILTPDSLYAGGGFKFGVMYTNTISWDFVSNVMDNSVRSEVTKIMKNKLKDLNSFESQISLTSIKFGGEIVKPNLIRKSCTRTGEFNAGSEITTVCTFFLPNAIVDDFTGKITYSISKGTNYGINNKYYVPLDYQDSKYRISAELSNMSVLKDSAALGDSDSNKKWTGNWNVKIDGDSCSLDIKSLYYQYIYRPIDLNNPFPNRNAGINWFDWYNIETNRARLREAYKNLQYSISIDKQLISEIKDYNQKQNANGGYFDWYTMVNEESSFLRKYFEAGGKK